MPEAEFIFIGPMHPDVASTISRLRQKSNIHFLGMKVYQQIPSYLQWCNVCIIPFQRNELTMAVNPVKLYEYSAAGKQTVVTNFSDDLAPFAGTVYIAGSKEEFVANLCKALERSADSSTVSSLKSFAREHDWNNKTSIIINLIEQHLSQAKN